MDERRIEGLPGAGAVVAASLAEVVQGSGKQGISRDRAWKQLAEKWDEEPLEAALEESLTEGRLLEWQGRLYLPRFTQWIVAEFRSMKRGDGLLLTGEDGEAGYFVSRRHRGAAVDGDRVQAKPLRKKRGRRKGGKLPEAVIVRVLAQRRPRLVGTVERTRTGAVLVPFDPKEALTVQLRNPPDVSPEEFVLVELDRAAHGKMALEGRVVEVLGDPSSPGVDVAVVLAHFDIPVEFPVAVLDGMDSRLDNPPESEFEDRSDLRNQTTVTIDGESAQDFDDAISIQKEPGGNYRLWVHIADVSHYVRLASALDREAYRRGTSVYFPGRAIPMLPPALSNGLCSLRPEVPRLSVTAELQFDATGQQTSRRFHRSVIRSDRRLTYDEVRRVLKEPAPEDREEYGEILELLKTSQELMRLRLTRRMERGSIDFDLPEGDVVLDTDGYTVGIRPTERTVAHRIIEQFMIAANEAVAEELEGAEWPTLYRVHDPPDRGKLEELRTLLAGFGIQLSGDLEQLHPSALQKVLQTVEGRPEESLVSSLVLRAMQRAIYSPEPKGHYALASGDYCHFTSPIRRYPDLVVHRQLMALIAGAGSESVSGTLLDERLPVMAAHTSRTERRAERAEREVLQWKKVRFLADRIGDAFTGSVTGVQPFGLFVMLDDQLVDGLVPIRTLRDDFYHYEPEAWRLVGERSGRTFRLGDPVEVVLTGINRRQRGLELAIADLAPEK